MGPFQAQEDHCKARKGPFENKAVENDYFSLLVGNHLTKGGGHKASFISITLAAPLIDQMNCNPQYAKLHIT